MHRRPWLFPAKTLGMRFNSRTFLSSDAKIALFDERERVVQLCAENDALKIQEARNVSLLVYGISFLRAGLKKVELSCP
jgi:hypothetical protein